MKAYEMHAIILTWRKCPSVTLGGKTYFHVAFCQNTKYTVVWDKQEESWTLTKNDVYVTNVSSVAKGKAYAERMAGETEPTPNDDLTHACNRTESEQRAQLAETIFGPAPTQTGGNDWMRRTVRKTDNTAE